MKSQCLRQEGGTISDKSVHVFWWINSYMAQVLGAVTKLTNCSVRDPLRLNFTQLPQRLAARKVGSLDEISAVAQNSALLTRLLLQISQSVS